jgi:hypothetical protein
MDAFRLIVLHVRLLEYPTLKSMQINSRRAAIAIAL